MWRGNGGRLPQEPGGGQSAAGGGSLEFVIVACLVSLYLLFRMSAKGTNVTAVCAKFLPTET